MPDRMLNYTTKVPVGQTAQEVAALLGEHGAAAVQLRYENKAPVAVSFVLEGPHGSRTFTLPADAGGVGKALRAQWRAGAFRRKGSTGGPAITEATAGDPQHHARVAWRILKDWLEAQLALVAVEMASLDQVMLPYLHVDPSGDRTLYQAYRENQQAALEAGTS